MGGDGTGGGLLKLRDLIERLEELEALILEGIDPDADPDVVAAYQPSWPLAGTIKGACLLPNVEEEGEVAPDAAPVVWIAIGSHPDDMSPYAPRCVFEEAQ